LKQLKDLLMILLLGFVLTGCSLKYDLHPPLTSSAEYEKSVKQNVVYVYDNQQDKKFIRGMTELKSVDLKIGNVENPVSWLAQSLEKEYLSHNISLTLTTDAALKTSADATLTVNKYQIVNSRSSDFHPYVAFHSFPELLQIQTLRSS
jgi:hypothetical protein